MKRVNGDCEVIRNDISPEKLHGDYKSLIISPGPSKPSKSGNLTALIEKYLGQIPILGICLGHQALGEVYGADLDLADEPVHGKLSKVFHNGDQIFKRVPSPFDAVRYHSLILRDLPEGLERIAWTEKGEVMGFRGKNDSVLGLQFHPEAELTESGFRIIKNWLEKP